ACNLDCSYCYVKKSSASMSESIGLDAVEKIFRTAQKRQFKDVKIKYAGGEATLQFRLIQTLSDHAKLLSRQSGLSLQQVILSNGTHINPENAAWMRENHVRLMISLDGVGKVHDQMRPYRNGKGSFEAVSHTIDQVLLPAGIIPMLTLTITQQNVSDVADAVRWVLERKLPLSLNFYRHKPGSQADLVAEENALIKGVLSAYKVYEEILPSRPFLNGLLDRVQAGSHLNTCGVGSSYLVISHEGALAQCQMLLERPVSPVLTDDLLAPIQNGPLRNLAVEQKETCRKCVYRYRCTGGCPLETYQASGRWDAPNPNCHIYKTLLPFAFRLEGLRLLRNHGYLN
ncbi:MAG: SPASM domain-containing protein, partial [Deltaproteobacteria bacterium]|nr:SPASM domain-containing protein [Deltaproteobacteria bacterium]